MSTRTPLRRPRALAGLLAAAVLVPAVMAAPAPAAPVREATAPAAPAPGPARGAGLVRTTATPPSAPVPGPARGAGLLRETSEPAAPPARDGFDWEAAGLGAGTAAALGLLGLAGMEARGRAVRHRAG